MQRYFNRTFYGLMVYCKIQCQNLGVFMYIHWSDTWYGENILNGSTLIYVCVDYLWLCGLALTVLLCSGLSRSLYFAHFGKRKRSCLVLSLIWFYILDDFILYKVGIFSYSAWSCYLCFFFFGDGSIIWRTYPDISVVGILTVLTCLGSHNYCTGQDLKPSVPVIA